MNYLLISYPIELTSTLKKFPDILMSTSDEAEAKKWQTIYQNNRPKEKIILVPVDVEGYQISLN